jgi:hypothetical protein
MNRLLSILAALLRPERSAPWSPCTGTEARPAGFADTEAACWRP